jgi:hypothetical protein
MIAALVAHGAVRVSREPWEGIRAILDDPDVARRMSEEGPRAVEAHRGATTRNVDVIVRALRASEEQPFRR